MRVREIYPGNGKNKTATHASVGASFTHRHGLFAEFDPFDSCRACSYTMVFTVLFQQLLKKKKKDGTQY